MAGKVLIALIMLVIAAVCFLLAAFGAVVKIGTITVVFHDLAFAFATVAATLIIWDAAR